MRAYHSSQSLAYGHMHHGLQSHSLDKVKTTIVDCLCMFQLCCANHLKNLKQSRQPQFCLFSCSDQKSCKMWMKLGQSTFLSLGLIIFVHFLRYQAGGTNRLKTPTNGAVTNTHALQSPSPLSVTTKSTLSLYFFSSTLFLTLSTTLV